MSSSSGSGNFGVSVAAGPSLVTAQQGQGVAALLVMLAVLCFIFAYCCWGAPFCRSFCRRHCCCRLEDPDSETNISTAEQPVVATPTIILLPHGRMLVVDGTIFTQLQADTTGLDLMELGESVIRAQRNPRAVTRHQIQSSQCSIFEMDAETPSKDSLGSVGCFPPPTYESIYGKEESDMPPSYSDILLHRYGDFPYEMSLQDFYRDGKDEIEMQSLNGFPRTITNPLNEIPYPYVAMNSFSSQSFPRRGVSRNSSIINNPLDSYYIDNELEYYRLNREIARNDERILNITGLRDNSSQNRNDEMQDQCNRELDSCSNEDMNTRNRRRSNSCRSYQDRISVNSFDANDSASSSRTHQGVSRMYGEIVDIDESQNEMVINDGYRTTMGNITGSLESAGEEIVLPEDDAGNFNTLTDIRESRV
ncbi:uncharacterized protein [Prorops nasuta]|uniref:uncharacterized protein n=1 Tax=Prorops nasuta TaxID=863751 RepID=UPI0034CDFE42